MVMGASRATRRPPRKWRVSPRTATTTSVAREHNALPITLEAANVCPYQGTSVIARDPLPAHAATFGDQLKMPIALRWRGLGRSALGVPTDRGGMTAASGWRPVTLRYTSSRSYAPSPINEATGRATCSRSCPTCEPSSLSWVVNSAATIWPTAKLIHLSTPKAAAFYVSLGSN